MKKIIGGISGLLWAFALSASGQTPPPLTDGEKNIDFVGIIIMLLAAYGCYRLLELFPKKQKMGKNDSKRH